MDPPEFSPLWKWVIPVAAGLLVVIFVVDLIPGPAVAPGLRSAVRPVACIAALALSVVVAAATLRRRSELVGRREDRLGRLESEGRFTAMADAMPALVWMSGPDGRPTYFNRAWLNFTGRALDEELRHGWAAGVHPDDRGACEAEYAAMVAGGRVMRSEHRRRRADGRDRWLLVSGSERRTADGRIAGFIGTCIDITDRREAEHALSASERRYRAIVEAQAELICRWRPDGTLTFVNEAYCRCFGRTREQLIGASFVPFIVEEDRPLVADVTSRLLAGQPIPPVDERVMVADGTLRWQRWTARRIHEDPPEFQSVGWDITELKEAESRLKQSLRLHEEQARRERLLRRELDHRVRNNLAGLLGLLRVYRRSADARSGLEQVEGKVGAMREMHELIAAADGEEIELARLCRRLADLCCPESRAAMVNVGVSRVSGAGGAVGAEHAGPLAMIIHELLTNSLKHGVLRSGENGRVDLDWAPRTDVSGGFVLRWVEVGESRPTPGPEGVGMGLIRGFASADLRGSCRFEFGERGLCFELQAGVPLYQRSPETATV